MTEEPVQRSGVASLWKGFGDVVVPRLVSRLTLESSSKGP